MLTFYCTWSVQRQHHVTAEARLTDAVPPTKTLILMPTFWSVDGFKDRAQSLGYLYLLVLVG